MKSSTLGYYLSIGLLATLLWACKGKNTTKPDNNKPASGQMLSCVLSGSWVLPLFHPFKHSAFGKCTDLALFQHVDTAAGCLP